MEVAREKMMPPSLLDVAAPRGLSKGRPEAPFYQCIFPAEPSKPPDPVRETTYAAPADAAKPASQPETPAANENHDPPEVDNESASNHVAEAPADEEDDDAQDTAASVVAVAAPADAPLPPPVLNDEGEGVKATEDVATAAKAASPETADAAEGDFIADQALPGEQEQAVPAVDVVAAMDAQASANAEGQSDAKNNGEPKKAKALRSSRNMGSAVAGKDNESPSTVNDASQSGKSEPVAPQPELKQDEQHEAALPETALRETALPVEPLAPTMERTENDAVPSSELPVQELAAAVEPPTVQPPAPANESVSAPPVAPVSHAPKPPSTLLRSKSASGESSARPAEIDPARFLGRVVKAFESAQQGDGEVRLRLHPAELGSLRVDVKVQEGALTARLQAETPEARTALVENLPMLRERLAEQGIRIDRFDVDLMDHSDRQMQQSPENERRDEPARPVAQRPRGPVEREAPAVRGVAGTNGLNVVV